MTQLITFADLFHDGDKQTLGIAVFLANMANILD